MSKVPNIRRNIDAAQQLEVIIEADQIPTSGRKGQWKCVASGNLQGIGGHVPSTARVTGEAYGKTEDEACRGAKRVATQRAPRGTYARHLQCDCEKL
jgi:hypothetical protein